MNPSAAPLTSNYERDTVLDTLRHMVTADPLTFDTLTA